ncbi:magnesium transporter [Kribbella sp. NPDC050820]|uniref:magnesium transporter n=1 Tax=Kribbella sp. NPDC050820 TaxID=3155408 RepID=UPI0033C3D754
MPDHLLETAAQHASASVPVAAPDDTVGEVLRGMAGRQFDTAAVVAVCADDRLSGVVTIERLLAADPDLSMRAVMDPAPPIVAPGTDQERAAWQAVKHGEPGLAVVDSTGRFRGLIAPQRLLAVLLAEHDEDMARLGGYLHTTAEARTASTEPVPHRLWHRLPWLLLGLAGALAAAGIVGAFEQALERAVLVAFFVPGVVYIADAVGTQTEALVIRGLSVGVGIRRIVVRETLTGVLVGALLGVVAAPAIWLLWNDVDVAVAVGLAVFAASSIATLVAMALPWLFARLGADPAFGSGPLATVIQDLLSIAIYFAAITVVTT